jgi:hypothetical protein
VNGAHLEVTLEPGASILGVVQGPGETPIAGASVSIGSDGRWVSLRSDSDGRFLTDEVKPGPNEVTVWRRGFVEVRSTFAVTDGSSTPEIKLQLAKE